MAIVPDETNPTTDAPRTVPVGKVLVLGAGLAGMSAASELARAGVRVTVLERDPVVGGLAKSLQHEGYTVDCGPHRFHSGDPQINEHFEKMLGENIVERERKSRIWMMNRFFYYPLRLENVLSQLPRWILVKILWDYVSARVKQRLRPEPDNSFEDWVTHRFGRTLYTIFFDVYTEKTWGLPCKEISADWASQRISLLSLADVVKKTVFKKRPQPRTYISSFHYPRRGGIGTLCERYREEVESRDGEVFTEVRIERIVTDRGRIRSIVYENGDRQQEDTPGQVISTIPIQGLLELLDPKPPAEIFEHAAQLKHRSLIFVYLILDRESFTDDHWIYIPEKDRLINRISEAKNFSAESAPPDSTVICVEVTCIQDDPLWTAPDAELAERVVNELTDMGFMKPKEVLGHFLHREPQGYPIYDIGYRKHLEACHEFFKAYENLLCIGRQGLFRYNNMDHSVTMGLRASHTILGRLEDYEHVAVEGDYFD